jgi:hypothetical protein
MRQRIALSDPDTPAIGTGSLFAIAGELIRS